MAAKSKPVSIGEWMPIDRVKRWDRNPRINDPAVPVVRASIREFGFVAPIVIWTSRDFMVAGHTRLRAMDEELAADRKFTPPGAPGPGLVPVRMHEFESESAAKAYALVDNRAHEFATWDASLLREAAKLVVDVDPALLSMAWPHDVIESFKAEPIPEGLDQTDAEWNGMPGFNQGDKTAFRSIVMHFHDQAGIDGFAALMAKAIADQKVSPKTRYMWFPEMKIERLADKRWVGSTTPASAKPAAKTKPAAKARASRAK